jgi:DNA modification methylase
MTPHLATNHVRLFHGDCREVLRQLADASVDSVVTDPPYELGFMGKAWDAQGVAYDVALWREVLRVLKPGGHLLAFGGTRTYHRLACAVEDAGFEVRDSIHWLYGSGFPKSLDVSKAIDKQRYDRAEVYEVTAWVRAARDAAGVTNAQIDAAFGFSGMAGHWTSSASQPAVPTLEQVPTLLEVLGVALDEVPDRVRRLLWDLNGRKGQPGENWLKREVTGQHDTGAPAQTWTIKYAGRGDDTPKERRDKAATPEVEQWQGWGTALKPAHEPVVVARKPLVGTVAANVLAHGTGALNIDGCRVGMDGGTAGCTAGPSNGILGDGLNGDFGKPVDGLGRWPANVVLGPEAAEVLDRQSGDDEAGASRFFTVAGFTDDDLTSFRYVAKPDRAERNAGLDGLPEKVTNTDTPPGTLGSNSPRAEANRNGAAQNFHPTVKPLDLMRWLVRLVTPPGGTVLEPFAGSGTTLAAAVLEGFDAVGIELTDDYLPLIEGRVRWAEAEARFGPVTAPTKVRKDAGAPTLFDEDGAA